MDKFINAISFDYGLCQIGVAFGQSLTGSAQALPILKARDGVPNWDNIQALLNEWQPQQLVVGLPLNMDDTESELSQRARKFARRLQGRFNLPVTMMDERLSSFSVKQDAKAQGHKGDYHRKPLDSLAAKLILEDWFRMQH